MLGTAFQSQLDCGKDFIAMHKPTTEYANANTACTPPCSALFVMNILWPRFWGAACPPRRVGFKLSNPLRNITRRVTRVSLMFKYCHSIVSVISGYMVSMRAAILASTKSIRSCRLEILDSWWMILMRSLMATRQLTTVMSRGIQVST
jgi:hypothetical protein